jgi:hypothetical protein
VGGRVEPLLALGIVPQSPTELTLTLPSPGTAADVKAALERASRPNSPSPYRALLGNLKEVHQSGAQLRLVFAHPFPDALFALCHPSLLGVGPGPYVAGRPNLSFPAGRPFPDELALSFGTDRQTSRLFALGQLDVRLGGGRESPLTGGAPKLYSTYLVFSPPHVGPEFRQTLEGSINPKTLVPLFVHRPAAPMTSLLPEALIPQREWPESGAPSAVVHRRVTLGYDRSNEAHRGVAERIQVKLHDRGFDLHLVPMGRAELGQAWANREFDTLLMSVLLPCAPAVALGVVLELGGRGDLAQSELTALGAFSDAKERATRARQRAEAVFASVPIVPLFSQGPRLEVSPSVQNLRFDDEGLPLLDDVFLSGAP